MTSKQRRPNAGVPAVKAFIAAASLAATVGGWAAFSTANANQLSANQNISTQAVVAQVASTSYNLPALQLTPLPTIVPIQNIKVSSGLITTQPVTQSSQPTATDVPPTDTVAPASDTPVPTATAVTVVRPRAVTTTRSSR